MSNRNKKKSKKKKKVVKQHYCLRSGTHIHAEAVNIIKCDRSTIVFNSDTYDIWFMASSDNQGNIHASVNIADPDGEATIKCSFTRKCSNLLIHRLPDGAYIECCQSYRQLQGCLRSRWKGKVTGSLLGQFSGDVGPLAAFMNDNIEEEFSINGFGTNCTRFALGFGDALGFSHERIFAACVELVMKVVPADKHEAVLEKFAETML